MRRRLPPRLAAVAIAACALALPASAVPAPADDALALINDRYRAPLGLPDLVASPQLAQAAESHADYWVLNDADPDLSAHFETPGRPGFTGAAPWERCLAAGAGFCGEVAFLGLPLVAATAGWLATPAHGEPLVWSAEIGFGESAAGSVGNFVGDVPAGPADPQAPINTPQAPLRVWPADGTRDVPITWWGAESPDPLAAYTGDRRDIGPVVFVSSAEDVDLSLTGPAGAVPLLRPFTDEVATSLRVDGGSSTSLFAARRLATGTSYTITASHSGRVEQVSFTTQVPVSPPPLPTPVFPGQPNLPPPVQTVPGPITTPGPRPGSAPARPARTRCRVSVKVSRQRRAVLGARGVCRGLRFQARIGGRWVGLTPRRALSGRTLRWRAREGGRIIASGRAAIPKARRHR